MVESSQHYVFLTGTPGNIEYVTMFTNSCLFTFTNVDFWQKKILLTIIISLISSGFYFFIFQVRTEAVSCTSDLRLSEMVITMCLDSKTAAALNQVLICFNEHMHSLTTNQTNHNHNSNSLASIIYDRL